MKYWVLKSFKVRTSKEEIELRPGQLIILQKDKAIKLIEQGKITPVEKIAYRIYSELLGCHLWIVETHRDMGALRWQGISETIYTRDEMKELRGISKESLKAIQKIKEVFDNSKVEEINRKEKTWR